MGTDDDLFDAMCAIGDEAEQRGFPDLTLVLEFALDVYLNELGKRGEGRGDAPDGAVAALESSLRQMKVRQAVEPSDLPSLGWSMSSFPLARLYREAS